jgi:molecular chaperone GrpE
MSDKDRQQQAAREEAAAASTEPSAEDAPREAQEAQAQEQAASPEEELERLRAENAELKDKYLRALADMENLRRRLMKEKEEAVKYAASDFARDMLSVCDNLSRAIESVPEEKKGEHELLDRLLEGVEMTLKDMLATFERHHIRKIPSHGEKFNPNVHEAMFEVEAGPEEAGKVVQVIQEGYTHHDRVLRPARVGVARNNGGEGGGKG